MAPVQPKTPEEYERARQMTNAMHSTIRMTIPFIFTLDAIEQLPAFGVLIGSGLDLLKLGLYSSAGAMNSIIPPLVGLIPVPLAGTVGIMVGWFMSVGLLMAYAAISLSRREFTDTLKAVLAMVPVMGTLLANTLQSVVTTGTKMANRYEKLKFQIQELWRKVSTIISSATDAATRNTIIKPGAAENVAKGMMNLTNVMQKQVASLAKAAPATLASPIIGAPPAPPAPPAPVPSTGNFSYTNPGPTTGNVRPPPPSRNNGASLNPYFNPKARIIPKQKSNLGGNRFTRRRRIGAKWPKTERARRLSRKH